MADAGGEAAPDAVVDAVASIIIFVSICMASVERRRWITWMCVLCICVHMYVCTCVCTSLWVCSNRASAVRLGHTRTARSCTPSRRVVSGSGGRWKTAPSTTAVCGRYRTHTPVRVSLCALRRGCRCDAYHLSLGLHAVVVLFWSCWWWCCSWWWCCCCCCPFSVTSIPACSCRVPHADAALWYGE